jgi:hypothetical protein
MATAAWLLPLLALPSMAGLPALIQAPPPLPAVDISTPRSGRGGELQSGRQLRLGGQLQQARWQLRQGAAGQLLELWLPLEVLQNQLGMSSRSQSSGALKLEWFGRELVVPATSQRSLDDEVAVDAAALLDGSGVSSRVQGSVLMLDWPPAALLGVRSSRQPGQRRVVLDLAGPALIRREGEQLWLGLTSADAQRTALADLGLATRTTTAGLVVQPPAGVTPRVFSLGEPARIVIDLDAATAGAPGSAAVAASTPVDPSDPRLLALLGKDLHWDRQVLGDVRLNAVRLDPRSPALVLRPLTRGTGGMEGLSSLQQLAARQDALVAVNGGYFNRVKRLPLGALKVDGSWLSGPILNRGVVAWSPGSMPRFGRLSLDEWISDRDGNRQPLVVVNSGYVQRGLSRYTADWGPVYRALSGNERALLVQGGRVQTVYGSQQLEQGVDLRPGDTLLVARGGVDLPWSAGDVLNLVSRPSAGLGAEPFVVGGGPLLLNGGQIVLDGPRESFSAAFLQQGAPRTVVASDGRQLWLITLEGRNDAGPSLIEAAHLLRQLGLQDALNLDGGSSTGLVMGGVMTVKGRGVAGSVHHGLGLVPRGLDSVQTGLVEQPQPTARVR